MYFPKKCVVCDSSSLISLANACFLPLLAELRKNLGADFIIGESVKHECIDHPLEMKSHTLPAIRIKLALNNGIIKAVSPTNIGRRTDDVLWVANNIFFSRESHIRIMHKGEAETLALAIELGLENVLIDERTSRMLIESPETMAKHIGSEFNRNVRINEKYLERFRDMTERLNLFRSSELLIMAYEHGYFKKFGELEDDAIEAALYGIKFAGCSISFEEIEEYVRSLKGK